MYEVTATRRRPRHFEDLVGQEFVAETLRNSIKSGQIAHAYLFSGPRGCGKTSTARILAKALNCQSGDKPTVEPCGECGSCVAIANSSSLDVIEIDGASNTSVNDVRQIKDEVMFPPNSCRYKIYIIDEVHMLSTSAFNALLKTIEEPPPYVIFIFATTELQKVPATIKSRCQQFHFRLVPVEQIKALLADAAAELNIRADDEALYWIARESGGSIRDSYTLFDQIAAFSGGHITYEKIRDKLGLLGIERLNELFGACASQNHGRALELLDSLLQSGISADKLIADSADYIRSLLLLKSGVKKEALLGQAPERFSADVLNAWNSVQIERALSLLLQLYRDIRYSVSPRYELDLAFSRLCWLRQYVSPAEVKAAIDAARSLLGGAGAATAGAAPAGAAQYNAAAGANAAPCAAQSGAATAGAATAGAAQYNAAAGANAAPCAAQSGAVRNEGQPAESRTAAERQGGAPQDAPLRTAPQSAGGGGYSRRDAATAAPPYGTSDAGAYGAPAESAVNTAGALSEQAAEPSGGASPAADSIYAQSGASYEAAPQNGGLADGAFSPPAAQTATAQTAVTQNGAQSFDAPPGMPHFSALDRSAEYPGQTPDSQEGNPAPFYNGGALPPEQSAAEEYRRQSPAAARPYAAGLENAAAPRPANPSGGGSSGAESPSGTATAGAITAGAAQYNAAAGANAAPCAAQSGAAGSENAAAAAPTGSGQDAAALSGAESPAGGRPPAALPAAHSADAGDAPSVSPAASYGAAFSDADADFPQDSDSEYGWTDSDADSPPESDDFSGGSPEYAGGAPDPSDFFPSEGLRPARQNQNAHGIGEYVAPDGTHISMEKLYGAAVSELFAEDASAAAALSKTECWSVSGNQITASVGSAYQKALLDRKTPQILSIINNHCRSEMQFVTVLREERPQNDRPAEIPPQVKIVCNVFKGSVLGGKE